jgi:FMN phosphatase YigB (HAD superfamily)
MTYGSSRRRQLLGMLSAFRVAVFDLDGTLYDDSLYYDIANVSIVRYITRITSIPVNDVRAALSYAQSVDGRSRYLDRVCDSLNLPKVLIADLLLILRTVHAQLNPYPWVEALFADLVAQDVSLYILTNGNREQQRNKVRSLGLDVARFPIEVVYASDHRPKPDPAGLRYILRVAGVSPQDVVVVGNDRTDEFCALACGAQYIDVEELRDCLSGEPGSA